MHIDVLFTLRGKMQILDNFPWNQTDQASGELLVNQGGAAIFDLLRWIDLHWCRHNPTELLIFQQWDVHSLPGICLFRLLTGLVSICVNIVDYFPPQKNHYIQFESYFIFV